MLYSDNFDKQIGGIEHLHSLAVANKNNGERVEEVLKVFCSFVKKVTSEKYIRTIERKNHGATITEKWREIPRKKPENIELLSAVKRVIMEKIAAEVDKGSSIYPSKKIDLSGADFQELDRTWWCNMDLRGANLQQINLQGAVLAGADLRGVDLRRAKLKDVTWTAEGLITKLIAQVNYAIVSFFDQGVIEGAKDIKDVKSIEDVIWFKNTDSSFTWRRQQQSKKDLIELLEKEQKAKTDKKMQDIITHVIDYIEKEFPDS